MSPPVSNLGAFDFQVIIVGAGPAGLMLGRELIRRNVLCGVLERGHEPGESWRRMPSALALVSLWNASCLPDDPQRPIRNWAPHRTVTRGEFYEYLKDYARVHAVPIRTKSEVRAVRRTPDGGFAVETADGVLTCRCVVSAAGYFQNPFWPDVPGIGAARAQTGATTSYICVHSADYGSADELHQRLGRAAKPGALILIVGQRLSAGQILVELAAAGFSVALSHRSPLRFGSGVVGQWMFLRILLGLEKVWLRWVGPAARGFEVRMPGGKARDLIERGTVQLFPAIARFEDDGVWFTNGARLKPDVVLFATGFRPVLEHLSHLGLTLDAASGRPLTRDMESVDAPGLFFLGLDRVRNFRSRFLRGLREDAAILAAQIERRLRDSKPDRGL